MYFSSTFPLVACICSESVWILHNFGDAADRNYEWLSFSPKEVVIRSQTIIQIKALEKRTSVCTLPPGTYSVMIQI